MKIRMKTLSCGPDGTLLPGKVYDLPDAEAKALVNGLYAERVENPLFDRSAAKSAPKPVERAVATPPAEKRGAAAAVTTHAATHVTTNATSKPPAKPAA